MNSSLAQPCCPASVKHSGLLAALVVLALATAVAEYWTGERFGLDALYVPIVALAAWRFGLGAGLGFAALAAVAGIVIHYVLAADPPPDSARHFSAQLTSTAVKLAVLAFVAWVLSRLRASLDEQRRLAAHDSLTGLANRQSLFARGEVALSQARRECTGIGAIFIDCDHFKTINDRWGHATGDELLCEVADCLRAVCEEGQLAARLGGDEFVIIAAGGTAAETADLAERLQTHFSDRMQARSCPLTLSIGAVWFARPGADLDQLVAAADEAMYAVKRGARGGVEFRRFEQESQVSDPASALTPHS